MVIKAAGLFEGAGEMHAARALGKAPALWTAVVLHRFRFKAQQIAVLRAGFQDEDDPASFLLNLMGYSPHSFLRVQMIRLPWYINS